MNILRFDEMIGLSVLIYDRGIRRMPDGMVIPLMHGEFQ